MYNFGINFTHPWLLLLLIPAVLLTLIPHLKLNKRYRKTRNRIVSIVLHLTIMVLCISVLAGLTFSYQIPNEKNEIIILVDVSDSSASVEDERDSFVKTVIRDSSFDNYNVGVVTFGFDQVYAVPLTTDVSGIYEAYKDAPLPDTSATDVAAALIYAKSVLTNPATAKIVLVSDGKETDETAITVIRSIISDGTEVDTAYLPATNTGNELQITSVQLPDYHVSENEACEISVTITSNFTENDVAEIKLYDNGECDSETGTMTGSLSGGKQNISFTHTFKSSGLHELVFKASVNGDTSAKNNEYHTFVYLEVMNKVLVIERDHEESEKINDILVGGQYDVTILDFNAEDDGYTNPIPVPTTVNELRNYDQVILNNIANRDMPDGFVDILYSYVYDFGGGLLTVGGDGVANVYNRQDMRNTTYEQMLPVQAIDYTPPLGVIFIIDVSGSMSSIDDRTGKSSVKLAAEGAEACLGVLSERDYVGIITLSSDYQINLPMTKVSEQAKVVSAIRDIGDHEAGGGTIFSDAFERAGQMLRATEKVDKRHV
ncbi:MAG: VWA domain-containing protein, partial [Clostridia bacterium]|nr:VWA domain-containing protein [Clostridia bacterium]